MRLLAFRMCSAGDGSRCSRDVNTVRTKARKETTNPFQRQFVEKPSNMMGCPKTIRTSKAACGCSSSGSTPLSLLVVAVACLFSYRSQQILSAQLQTLVTETAQVDCPLIESCTASESTGFVTIKYSQDKHILQNTTQGALRLPDLEAAQLVQGWIPPGYASSRC